ncbi:hypothetical protein JAAARDRAFT_116740 [Jaapia argillacea MUCL 33604]|uniref:Nop14-like protein n=1 Tax=Jaapia argillacea MUCL 33604 TaxID=933084 RepID=A0A067QAV6_9AGAM|nr:hypothetical protein JAAARDRAFT_116740 [Jaapia argillacea MUCL 33604]
MGKGSQLSQLKSAISQAGLSHQSQPNKKRKRSGVARPDQVDKEKKAAKLKEIHEKLNPFDVKVTKLKHDVGGRKVKGVTGRPAQSRQAGLEQRNKTLLKEYAERNHAGGILDRRFGENDPTMTPEERMLERFTRERQRASKGDAFNLEDEEELTHYGQSLSKLDDFDGVGLGLEDEEDEDGGQIDGDVVKKVHFGGFDDDEEGEEGVDGEPPLKKSKAEVMAEVIAKSKEHKFIRQEQKGQDEDIRQKLDMEFDDLKSLLYNTASSSSAPVNDVFGTETDKDKEYDEVVRELAFEKRAKPKDRTKTEEELALEEKERLEKLERKRKRRMLGEDDDYDSEEDDTGRGRKGKKRERGGDDLDDDFDEGEEGWDGLGVGLGGERQDEVEGESDEGSEDQDEDSEDEDEDVGTNGSDESEGELGEHEALVANPSLKKVKRSKYSVQKGQKSKELPFTFPCPSTHEEFLEIVEDVEDEDVPTVVQRIRALYHPSLAEDNKFKLQTLTSVLIDHILYITSPPTPRFTLLSSLVPHLHALTKSYPIPSAQHFIEKLSLMQKNLKRGLSHGALDPESKTWPGQSELALLRVIGAIWPTSDMKHPVASPARLIMGSYLGLGRLRTLSDIASGLFLSTLFLQYEAFSKRLVPEAVNFLVNVVLHLAPHGYERAADVPGSFSLPDFRSDLCLGLRIKAKKSKKLTVGRPDLVALLNGSGAGEDEQVKLDLLATSLGLLDRFAEMYKGLEGFIELCQPILEILQAVEHRSPPDGLKSQLSSLVDKMSRLLKFSAQSRQPLRLQAHKPIPIPTYIPKFEWTSSNYLRNRDPDQERNAASKLRKQYKQEKKGALRELRKDARFLAGVQQKEQMDKDKSYTDRMKRVFGSIEGERAEEKAMEREKKKEKRRAGKK